MPVNYITTWFYRESKEEASFYPQLGKKGHSALVHSVYMQIQVPFFHTFRHCHPTARLVFFTNLAAAELPGYLQELFTELDVEVVWLPYACRPPKDWYAAWQNQFYLFDILRYMGRRMGPDDTLLVCDADCLCRRNLDPLFDAARRDGSALYEFITDPAARINGLRLPEMEQWYTGAFGTPPSRPLSYYGGEFIVLRADKVRAIAPLYEEVWRHNLDCRRHGRPTLNEEAHVMSVLAERLALRNATANAYVKRMWTSPQFNNVVPGDEQLAVWHLPYEKKRGLYRLYRDFRRGRAHLADGQAFWQRAGLLTGIPTIGLGKRLADRLVTLWMKLH